MSGLAIKTGQDDYLYEYKNSGNKSEDKLDSKQVGDTQNHSDTTREKYSYVSSIASVSKSTGESRAQADTQVATNQAWQSQTGANPYSDIKKAKNTRINNGEVYKTAEGKNIFAYTTGSDKGKFFIEGNDGVYRQADPKTAEQISAAINGTSLKEETKKEEKQKAKDTQTKTEEKKSALGGLESYRKAESKDGEFEIFKHNGKEFYRLNQGSGKETIEAVKDGSKGSGNPWHKLHGTTKSHDGESYKEAFEALDQYKSSLDQNKTSSNTSPSSSTKPQETKSPDSKPEYTNVKKLNENEVRSLYGSKYHPSFQKNYEFYKAESSDGKSYLLAQKTNEAAKNIHDVKREIINGKADMNEKTNFTRKDYDLVSFVGTNDDSIADRAQGNLANLKTAIESLGVSEAQARNLDLDIKGIVTGIELGGAAVDAVMNFANGKLGKAPSYDQLYSQFYSQASAKLKPELEAKINEIKSERTIPGEGFSPYGKPEDKNEKIDIVKTDMHEAASEYATIQLYQHMRSEVENSLPANASKEEREAKMDQEFKKFFGAVFKANYQNQGKSGKNQDSTKETQSITRRAELQAWAAMNDTVGMTSLLDAGRSFAIAEQNARRTLQEKVDKLTEAKNSGDLESFMTQRSDLRTLSGDLSLSGDLHQILQAQTDKHLTGDQKEIATRVQSLLDDRKSSKANSEYEKLKASLDEKSKIHLDSLLTLAENYIPGIGNGIYNEMTETILEEFRKHYSSGNQVSKSDTFNSGLAITY